MTMEREDYFFGEAEKSGRKRVYALVIYDIAENKTRLKFAKFLNGYGVRVQKSGFEIQASENKFRQLLQKIPNYCGTQDSIRVYRIEGKNLVYKWGIDLSQEPEDVIII